MKPSLEIWIMLLIAFIFVLMLGISRWLLDYWSGF